MMNNKLWLALVIGIIFVLGACSRGPAETQPAGSDPAANTAPPAEYAGKSSPLAGDAAAAETGKQLFATNCASCHGPEGKGDGPASAALNPKPKDLASEMTQLQDDYIFWRISEGGMKAPFHSSMPAWKNILTEEQVWQMIAYMHTLQP